MPTIIIIANSVPAKGKRKPIDLNTITCDTTRFTCDNDKPLIVNLEMSSIRQEFNYINDTFIGLYEILAPDLIIPMTTDSIITTDSIAIIY